MNSEYFSTIVATVIALAAIASVTALCIVGKVDGEVAVTLLSTVVGGGLVHAGHTVAATGS